MKDLFDNPIAEKPKAKGAKPPPKANPIHQPVAISSVRPYGVIRESTTKVCIINL